MDDTGSKTERKASLRSTVVGANMCVRPIVVKKAAKATGAKGLGITDLHKEEEELDEWATAIVTTASLPLQLSGHRPITVKLSF